MELRIQKWGDSAAVRLPIELLGFLGVALGDSLLVDLRADGVILKPKRRAFSLDDLVALCDTAASEPADMADWGNSKQVGREAC
ncbi:AbrB/MazE/SpoVT family DNA-binding domain-containing protein [Pseudoduganella namucuonensis]|uniref:Antitoxin ChpS n=1 Tax=Pseudoduganella namucuonensis TaxID=1035707 RepID=A0A1I7KSY1_9BURK|nr:AbrB/MazE/SpoVT family DNA-binding domain-containing protein [Pseudoduganella namucuonensis]SFV00551.1 antitoxin ChpS [Pseudoduganella namucuonensis]